MKTTDKVRRLLTKGLTAPEIAKRLRIHASYVHTVKWLDKKKAKAQPERSRDPNVVEAEKKYVKSLKKAFKPGLKPSKLMQAVEQMNRDLAKVRKLDAELLAKNPTKLFVRPEHKDAAMKILADNDLVNKPPHYTDGGVDTLKFIEAKDLNFRLGNVVKYVSRAGKKAGADPVQDLEKARFYLEREIEARRNA